jgi:hypothetical protein
VYTWVHCGLQVNVAEMSSEDEIVDAIVYAINEAKQKPRISYDPTEADSSKLVRLCHSPKVIQYKISGL